MSNPVIPGIPAHIPAGLILQGNPWAGLDFQVHETLARLQEIGDVVYTPVHHIPGLAPNGSWLITRCEPARELLLDTENFSSANQTGVPQALNGDFVLAPIECDPPEHTKIRALLTPMFTPRAVREFSDKIRQRSAGLIDAILARGSCDFVHDYAKVLPSEIFLDMFGLPHEKLDEFLEWEELIMGSSEFAKRLQGLQLIAEYLRGQIKDRMAAPRGDMMSAVAGFHLDGTRITSEQALGVCLLLYIAGLDTVVNSLGWQFLHLARNPADQERLRRNPEQIPRAVEEMLRGYSVVSLTRVVTKDLDFAGVRMLRGDMVTIPTPIISRDAQEYPDPGRIDLDRGTGRHFGFGFGPHLCLGMHLARLELTISLELWLSKLPQFRVAEGAELPTRGGAVLSLEHLPLIWS